MESVWEKEIRELLDSLALESLDDLLNSLMSESLDDLLKEIAEAPIPFIDYEPTPKARRTRTKRTPKTPE
jgi:hypothetical protein